MEGRGRSRRDYPSRSEEKSRSDRANNPPSRHLWVGNLSHNLTERAFVHHFSQFGELASVAFQPARSYAFVNYRNDDDAFVAIKELQGFSLAGNPLRIEFAKAEKSLASARDVHYSEWRDDYPKGRGSPSSQRDSREHWSSPETSHPKKSKMNDKDVEPSEVLWIGFPAQLRVDEFVLRKAFAPFGEIEKITTFPGRTYAFVRFRKVMSACRAKETLQGKLFGNPRVHICFAKSDSGPSNKDRSSINGPPSPPSGPYERSGSFDRFQSDRNFGIMSEDPDARSPYNLDPSERNVIGRGRDSNLWSGGNDALEHRRYLGQGSGRQLHGNFNEHPDSPPRNFGGRIREFSPHKYSRQSAMYDDPWDLPEDDSLLHGSKKIKTLSFPSENDLPEYPFSDLEKAKYAHPQDVKLYDSRNSGYWPIPERSANRSMDGNWNAVRDDFHGGSMPLVPIDRRRPTPDRRESSSKEVWKWEGVLAKGGNPICRARCFPVGKPPDMVLPEYLDCTARTTLDMLSKHYYQSISACAVFFVPANDPDISSYNEFMSYLGERQRAAVAKLDDATTLFLVPPSEFSEKVLKVPGKLSISGVVLRLAPTSGSSYGSVSQYNSREAYQNDLPYQKPISPPGPYTVPPFSNDEKYANLPAGSSALGHDYRRNPTALPPPPPLPVDHPYNAAIPRTVQEAMHRAYTPDNSKFIPPAPSSIPFSNLPPEQVAQLASSLLGQQGIAGTAEYMPSANVNQSGYAHMVPNYELPNDQTQLSQMQQLQQCQQQQQQQQAVQNLAAGTPQMAQPSQNPGQGQGQGQGQDEGESDPQKRLQATLQLAAALLQQIQQGKGS